MARSNVTLNIYKIEKPDWSQAAEAHKNSLVKIITSGGWHRYERLRRGFLNCQLEADILYGYFAQEGRIKIEQYNDAQQPHSEEKESFERILFLLFLESGVLAVQNIRVARYIDLTGTEIRENFFDLLETAFRQANLIFRGAAVFERYKEELSREDLIQIFESHEIRRIRVRDLENATVPEEFRFFNPNFDKDEFLKAVIEEDLKNTTETEWQGVEIQQAKIPRGLMHAGNPTLVEGIDDSGFVREWTPSAPQSISIELDADEFSLPEEDLKRLLDVIGRSFGFFSDRLRQFQNRKDVGDLPLFDTRNE